MNFKGPNVKMEIGVTAKYHENFLQILLLIVSGNSEVKLD